MAILQPGDPIFAQVFQGEFQSPFPSQDALLDPKFKALLSGIDPASKTGETLASQVLCRAQGVAWQQALSMANKIKATVVGDFPSAWIPRLAFTAKGKGALGGSLDALQGLWAEVAFPQSADPARLGWAIAQVGLEVALNFAGAVPIVGGILKFIMNLGDMLASLFTSSQPTPVKKLYLPWGAYSKDTDEDLVKLIINQYYGKVDWTGIFLPPFDTSVEWKVVTGVQDKEELGKMWVPWKDKQLAVSSQGLGCMPGTYRMAGYVQSPGVPQESDERLLRYFSDGTLIRWGRVLTDQGDFFPATSQTGVLAWQQAQKAGSPDMYKVDCDAVEAAWIAYFDRFFDSLWKEYTDNDEWAGEFAAPYLAVKTNKWRLGWRDPDHPVDTEIHRPHPAALITPDIFTKGAATEATRNPCLFEESMKGPTEGGTNIMAKVYEREPGSGRFVKSGGRAVNTNNITKGFKCSPWPSGYELLSTYARPDDAFILPAVRRLRKLQERALESTLVSAYCRPVEVAGLPAYAAFAANKKLRDRCLEVRKILLGHDARFQVNLRDVADIDPQFEKQLRAAGVTNSPSQMAMKFGKISGSIGKDEPLPDALPPAKGTIPFDRPEKSKGGGAVPLIAAASAAAYFFLGK